MFGKSLLPQALSISRPAERALQESQNIPTVFATPITADKVEPTIQTNVEATVLRNLMALKGATHISPTSKATVDCRPEPAKVKDEPLQNSSPETMVTLQRTPQVGSISAEARVQKEQAYTSLLLEFATLKQNVENGGKLSALFLLKLNEALSMMTDEQQLQNSKVPEDHSLLLVEKYIKDTVLPYLHNMDDRRICASTSAQEAHHSIASAFQGLAQLSSLAAPVLVDRSAANNATQTTNLPPATVPPVGNFSTGNAAAPAPYIFPSVNQMQQTMGVHTLYNQVVPQALGLHQYVPSADSMMAAPTPPKKKRKVRKDKLLECQACRQRERNKRVTRAHLPNCPGRCRAQRRPSSKWKQHASNSVPSPIASLATAPVQCNTPMTLLQVADLAAAAASSATTIPSITTASTNALSLVPAPHSSNAPLSVPAPQLSPEVAASPPKSKMMQSAPTASLIPPSYAYAAVIA